MLIWSYLLQRKLLSYSIIFAHSDLDKRVGHVRHELQYDIGEMFTKSRLVSCDDSS